MNTQNLLRLIRNNEEACNFDLGLWVQDCGTFGCLVGNDYIAGKTMLTFDDYSDIDFDSICAEYEVTKGEAQFLFLTRDRRRVFNATRRKNIIISTERCQYDKDAAMNRVRKFIYYKLHKQEMMSDPKYRYLEGDHLVVNATITKLNSGENYDEASAVQTCN